MREILGLANNNIGPSNLGDHEIRRDDITITVVWNERMTRLLSYSSCSSSSSWEDWRKRKARRGQERKQTSKKGEIDLPSDHLSAIFESLSLAGPEPQQCKTPLSSWNDQKWMNAAFWACACLIVYDYLIEMCDRKERKKKANPGWMIKNLARLR